MRSIFIKKQTRPTLLSLSAIVAVFAGVALADDAELMRLLRSEKAQPTLENRVPGGAVSAARPQASSGSRIPSPQLPQNAVSATPQKAVPSVKLPTPNDRVAPATTPSWQKKYTVGPGDTLNVSYYDRPDLERGGIPIAPDGTISYLQAVGVKVAGLSIGEVRKKLEKELSAYHKAVKLIVTPGELGSKRISVIGRVREPGSFPLDRPTSILEAIAAAQGIEVGSIGGSAFELADLDHSFVARNGRKLDVNIAKLYFQGDFSQNALLEPNDYVFIASALKNEYYILGAVNDPGRRKMPTKMTVMRAITESGGFEEKAFRTNVLLIRGGIHEPETQVINVKDILTGKSPDVLIENRDILFVHRRPFYIAENALDSALITFVQTVSTEAINQNYNPLSISTP